MLHCSRPFNLPFERSFFLEGIHVVPRGVQPPTYSCIDGTIIQTESGLLTGQTTPESAAFELEIFARNIDTNRLQSVCRTSITRGVQWLPFVSPHNTIATDHLIFRGSFENLTILIHGGEVDRSELTSQAVETVNAGPPVPSGWTGSEGKDDDRKYLSFACMKISSYALIGPCVSLRSTFILHIH